MQKLVGLFPSRGEAEGAIQGLKAIGLRIGAISVAMKECVEANSFENAFAADDGTGPRASASASTLVKLALAGSTVVFPGVGTFLVSGPFADAAENAGACAAARGILGVLLDAGVPECETKDIAAGLEEGQILIAASVSEPMADKATAVLESAGSRLHQSATV